MTHTIDTCAAAITVLTLTGNLINELVTKNLISSQDAQKIVQTTMDAVFQENQIMRVMSRQALQGIFPNMTIQLDPATDH